MADDYATWRPQAEADWTDEEWRVKFERLGAAGEVYFAELRRDNERLRSALIDICTTLDDEGRVAPGALETARMLVYPLGDSGALPYLGTPREIHGPFYLWGYFPSLGRPVLHMRKKESYHSSQRAERARVPLALSLALAVAIESQPMLLEVA